MSARTRTSWRLPYIHPLFFSKTFFEKKTIKTSLRFLTLPFVVLPGCSFYVHNGKNFNQVIYKKEMAGFKLGSFSLTKKIGQLPKAAKKKNTVKRNKA